jgi:hypothetical protein
VKNLDDAFKRIYDYVLELESQRMKKAYGMGSSIKRCWYMKRRCQEG